MISTTIINRYTANTEGNHCNFDQEFYFNASYEDSGYII